jgi:hypothetical protein
MRREGPVSSSDLNDNPILLKALDLARGLSAKELVSQVCEIRRSFLSARLLGKQVRGHSYEQTLDDLNKVAFIVEDCF